jgi:uncharacterized protein (DUF2336 family)
MTGLLSNADVARLMTDPSADARIDLAERLGRQMEAGALTTAELGIAQDIVRALARDVEAAVRETLSRNLRSSPHLPRDAALRMAQDIERVSLPILAESLVLTDEDLIELVRSGSPGKQAAIAAREAVSAAVSDALIDHGHEQAVAALMANPGAEIAEAGFARAIERFPASEAVHEEMVTRAALPMTVAERLAVLVSRRLQNHLVQNHALPTAVATDLVMRGREDAIIRLSAGADEPSLGRMVAQMRNTKRLTSNLVVRALCAGDLAFFEAALASMAGIPVDNARLLVHDAGRSGLESLYHKAGLPQAMFPMVRAAVDTMNETGFDGGARDLERFRARVIARVLTRDARGDDPGDSDYLVQKLEELLAA